MPKPFDSRKYRRQNQVYGVLVRWWKALPCECVGESGVPGTNSLGEECELCEGNSGLNYIEQEIPLSVFDGQPCRVLLGETAEAMEDREFGQIEQGRATIQPMFDELPMARRDRVEILDANFWERVTTTLVRGEGDLDALPRDGSGTAGALDVSILTANRVLYRRGRDFEISDDGAGLEWLDAPGATRPDEGARYSLEFAVAVPYTLLDVSSGITQASSDGGALPREFVLNR